MWIIDRTFEFKFYIFFKESLKTIQKITNFNGNLSFNFITSKVKDIENILLVQTKSY